MGFAVVSMDLLCVVVVVALVVVEVIGRWGMMMVVCMESLWVVGILMLVFAVVAVAVEVVGMK